MKLNIHKTASALRNKPTNKFYSIDELFGFHLNNTIIIFYR